MAFSDKLKGFLCILLADILWGLSATVAKYLFNQQISPFDLVQVRLILSSVLLLAYLAAVNPEAIRVKRPDLPYLFIFGTMGMATVQFTYLFTISETNVATAVFLEYLAPIFIFIYELLRGREGLTKTKMLSLAGAMAGGFLIVKGTPGAGMAVTPLGLASGLTSAVSFAFLTVYSSYRLKKYSAWTTLLWGMGIGGLVWCIYQAPWVTFLAHGLHDWLFFLYIAVFATIIPYGLFFKGIKYLSPVVAGITSTMEPVAAGILAFLILGEVLTNMQITGGILILAAVIAIQLRPDKVDRI